MTRPHLPDDIEALKDLVMENYQRANEHFEKYKTEHQRAELYKFKLENLTRQHFGRSSEKLSDSPEQQLLFELPTRPAAPVPEPVITPVSSSELPNKHGG